MISRSESEYRVHVATSFNVLAQPRQYPVRPSMAQTLMHGDFIGVRGIVIELSVYANWKLIIRFSTSQIDLKVKRSFCCSYAE